MIARKMEFSSTLSLTYGEFYCARNLEYHYQPSNIESKGAEGIFDRNSPSIRYTSSIGCIVREDTSHCQSEDTMASHCQSEAYSFVCETSITDDDTHGTESGTKRQSNPWLGWILAAIPDTTGIDQTSELKNEPLANKPQSQKRTAAAKHAAAAKLFTSNWPGGNYNKQQGVFRVVLMSMLVFMGGATSSPDICESANITITESPNYKANNGTLIVGEHMSVYLPCEYTHNGKRQDLNLLPFWRIQNSDTGIGYYFIGLLPVNHHYNGTGLVINDTPMTLNTSEYLCCFDTVKGEGLCESESVTLLVIPGKESDPAVSVPASTSTAFASSKADYNTKFIVLCFSAVVMWLYGLIY